MKNWFSSDWHLGHKNVIRFDDRPFATIEEHDKAIIDNYNEVVVEEDNFYFLGDLSYKINTNRVDYYLSQLNGNKFFIKGNHCNSKIVKLYEKHGTYLGQLAEITIEQQLIIICHYSMRVWNKSHRGSWHLYGHSHGSLEHLPNGKSFDVATNLWNYYPLEFAKIKEEMEKRDYKQLDKH